VLAVLRWLIPSLVPTMLAAYAVRATARRKDPPLPLIGTFVLGMIGAAVALFIQAKAAEWTGLDLRASVSGDAGALLFIFALVEPVREAAKVAACWPAFRSRHFDEPYDGVVYAGTAALGFAAIEAAVVLHKHPVGSIWIARALLAVPAHLFFASLWGYALGRAKQLKRPGSIFPATWTLATLGHALYAHFVYGRGPGALVAIFPMLLVMATIAGFLARDLRMRGERSSRSSGNRLSASSSPVSSGQSPSLNAVREALRRADQPIRVRWIAFGALVTLGAMIAGLAGAVAFGRWAHVDFALVDEHDMSTTAPVALLGSGLLAAFPLSGFLVARASGLPTLLEPALASAAAIATTLVLLGLAAPLAMVFALAFSPVAFVLACAGAWVGRVEKR
jgi:RsiW-degrading membrane proteinase PrsW (M82 family)